MTSLLDEKKADGKEEEKIVGELNPFLALFPGFLFSFCSP